MATTRTTRGRSNDHKRRDEFAELLFTFSRFVDVATELGDNPPDRLHLTDLDRQNLELAAEAARQSLTDLALAFGRQGAGLDH